MSSFHSGEDPPAQFAGSVIERLPSHGRRISLDALKTLAVEAAQVWSERTGRPLPEMLDPVAASSIDDSVRSLQRSWLLAADEASAQRYLDDLGYQVAAAANAGEYVSSPSMVRLASVAALARLPRDTGPLRILDLACGLGSMLLAVAADATREGFTVEAMGQELDPNAARFATASLFMGGPAGEVRVGNSLTDDMWPGEVVDLAVCQPPFGLSWDRCAEGVRRIQEAGEGFTYGLPHRADSTWLFISRMLEKLVSPRSGGGRVVAFAAPKSLQGGGSDAVRKAVLEADLLEAVIGLPGGLTPSTEIPLYALVFTNTKPVRDRGKVRVINLRPYFVTAPNRAGTARTLPDEAFASLAAALGSPAPTSISRTLPVEYFRRQEMTVSRSLRAPGARRFERERTAPSWRVNVPLSEDPTAWLRSRYGGLEVAWQPSSSQAVSTLEISSIFDPPLAAATDWARSRGWRLTRFSALLAQPPADATDEETAEATVLLPTGRGDASLDTGPDAGDGRRLRLRFLDDVSAGFLVAWLNSPTGRELRRRAIEQASTGTIIQAVRTEPRALMRFMDELVIPITSMQEQQTVAGASATLDAAAGMVERAREEIWESRTALGEVTERFEPLFDTSLGSWASDLPYPLASALWTLESKSNNLDAAHRQMFLVWEAFAAFTGTVLLSALAQDDVLRLEQSQRLRSAMDRANLTMQRATLGSWNVVIQLLSARFRRLLDSDDSDERARVLQMFGSPPAEALARIIGSRAVQLLADAANKRNLWAGHAGSVAERELRDQLDQLTRRLEELREEVSTAWRQLPLVMAGSARLNHGNITQEVELVMGPNTPFRRNRVHVGQMMEEGELYLAAAGAPEPLPVQHLLVMRPSPDHARYACYFYNRTSPEGVRLVSYHMADPSELSEPLGDIEAAVGDLS